MQSKSSDCFPDVTMHGILHARLGRGCMLRVHLNVPQRVLHACTRHIRVEVFCVVYASKVSMSACFEAVHRGCVCAD